MAIVFNTNSINKHLEAAIRKEVESRFHSLLEPVLEQMRQEMLELIPRIELAYQQNLATNETVVHVTINEMAVNKGENQNEPEN